MRQIRVIVERHVDQFIAYPVGIKQTKKIKARTYKQAIDGLWDVAQLSRESFPTDVMVTLEPPVLEAATPAEDTV